MNPEDLLFDSSKMMVLHNAALINNNPELFEPMLMIGLGNDRPKATRALRALFVLLENNPILADPFLGDILDTTEKCSDESIMFNLLHLLTAVNLPEDDEYIGRLTNICLDWIERKVERVAIKVYALDLLFRISLIYPEFKQELKLIIGKMQDEESMSIKCRTSRIQELLNKR